MVVFSPVIARRNRQRQFPAVLSLWRGGTIYLGWAPPRRTRALAVAGGRVVAIGAAAVAQARALPGDLVDEHDLAGGILAPAFGDAHVHLLPMAERHGEVDLSGCADLAEAQRRISGAAERLPAGAWVRGGGFHAERWGLGRPLAATDLDGLAGGRPVALASHDLHAVWANREALAFAGIGRSTPNPAGGRIERDRTGRPSGLLLENACQLLLERIPAGSAADTSVALAAVLTRLAAAGIVEVHDLAYRHEVFPLAALAALPRPLPVRVVCAIPAEMLDSAAHLALPQGFGDDDVALGGVKMMTDGALGSRTALLEEPYEGTAERGVAVLDGAALASLVGRALAAGLPPWIHAIGDAALRVAVETLESYRAELAALPVRPAARIEHAQLGSAALFRRLARLPVVLSVQPSHLASDREMARRLWGKRCRRAYAYGSMWRAGCALAFGSDAPVEPASPFSAVAWAAARTSVDGEAAFHPEQALPLDVALDAATRGALRAGGRLDRGTLDPGQRADMVVLDRDPRRARPIEDVANVRVLETWKDGRRTYLPRGALHL